MKRTIVTMVILGMMLCASPAGAQSGDECAGDSNHDGKVTVVELVAAVYSALRGCPSPESEGCLASGGTVSTRFCCMTAPEFPDTCAIGSCGCAPDASREVNLCDCGDDACFDRSARACVPQSAP